MAHGKGIFISRDLIQSKAWLSLTGASQTVYLLFRLRCKMEKIKAGGKPGMRASEWIIANNGDIVFTYAEAEQKYGIRRSRFVRAIDDLIAKGFVDIKSSGRGVRRLPTLYTLGHRWRLYGSPDFEEKSRIKSKQFNPGFRKGNTLWRRNKKIPSVVRDTVHGVVNDTVVTLRTQPNGKMEKYRYKHINNQWLRTKIA